MNLPKKRVPRFIDPLWDYHSNYFWTENKKLFEKKELDVKWLALCVNLLWARQIENLGFGFWRRVENEALTLRPGHAGWDEPNDSVRKQKHKWINDSTMLARWRWKWGRNFEYEWNKQPAKKVKLQCKENPFEEDILGNR